MYRFLEDKIRVTIIIYKVFPFRLPDDHIYRYRNSLFPSVFAKVCRIWAPPRNPDPITMVTIYDPYFIDGSLFFIVNWTLPAFYNNEIKRMEIQVLSGSSELVTTLFSSATVEASMK